jgi:hypothetical protein
MSETIKLNAALPESRISEYEEVAARMKKRDEHLTRHLRRMRILVRILDLGFGFDFSFAWADVDFLLWL